MMCERGKQEKVGREHAGDVGTGALKEGTP